MGVFEPPSIRAKIARSIRHIMSVPTMLKNQKNSSGNVVKCACQKMRLHFCNVLAFALPFSIFVAHFPL